MQVHCGGAKKGDRVAMTRLNPCDTLAEDTMLSRRTCLALLVAAAVSAFAQDARDTFEGVERLVAIGDIHGDYDRFVGLLRVAKLIDDREAWTGGKSHLVLTGDFLDRGPASAKVMDLLMELEGQAESAGGRVHAMIGNHEAMNVYGDLRYVPKEEYKSYATPKSAEVRERALKSALDDLSHKGAPPDKAEFRKKFEAEHPLGWVEHCLAFSPAGKYGKWIRRQNAVIKINDLIFLHGGISSKYAAMSRQEINRRVRDELEDFSKLEGGIVMDPDGPLWYRGLAQSPEYDKAVAATVDQVLKTQQARHIVIGHTPVPAIMPRFGGKVIAIDVGLSKLYGGPPAFLLVEDSKYYAMHRGHRLDLPVNGTGLLQYLNAAATLDPPDSRLRKLLEKSRPQ